MAFYCLGLGVVGVGLVFSHLISSYFDTGIGIIMVGAGLIVRIRPLVQKSTHHHDHEHHHDLENRNNTEIHQQNRLEFYRTRILEFGAIWA